MSQFQPSDLGDIHGAYGQTEEGQSTAETLEEYAPAISSFLFGGDPREKYAKKQASLENYTQLYNDASSPFLRNVYAMKIRTLQSEIEALEGMASEEETAGMLTQGTKVGGIILLVGLSLTGVMAANYFFQKAKTEQARRKQITQSMG